MQDPYTESKPFNTSFLIRSCIALRTSSHTRSELSGLKILVLAFNVVCKISIGTGNENSIGAVFAGILGDQLCLTGLFDLIDSEYFQ